MIVNDHLLCLAPRRGCSTPVFPRWACGTSSTSMRRTPGKRQRNLAPWFHFPPQCVATASPRGTSSTVWSWLIFHMLLWPPVTVKMCLCSTVEALQPAYNETFQVKKTSVKRRKSRRINNLQCLSADTRHMHLVADLGYKTPRCLHTERHKHSL